MLNMCRDMNPRDTHPKAHLVITTKLHPHPSRMHKMVATGISRHPCPPLMPVLGVQVVLMEAAAADVPAAVAALVDVPADAGVSAADKVADTANADAVDACLR